MFFFLLHLILFLLLKIRIRTFTENSGLYTYEYKFEKNLKKVKNAPDLNRDVIFLYKSYANKNDHKIISGVSQNLFFSKWLLIEFDRRIMEI